MPGATADNGDSPCFGLRLLSALFRACFLFLHPFPPLRQVAAPIYGPFARAFPSPRIAQVRSEKHEGLLAPAAVKPRSPPTWLA